MTRRIPVETYEAVRFALEDLATPARTILAGLDDDQAEAARQLGKLGIVALFARGPVTERDRYRWESVWLRVADRSDDARAALLALAADEAEAFRVAAVDAGRSIFDGRSQPYPAQIRGP